MHFIRIPALFAGLLAFGFLASCAGGGADGPPRSTASITPLVVLTVTQADGSVLGGLDDGAVDTGGTITSWPVELHAQVFLPSGTELGDGTPVVGSNVSEVGKIHFGYSTDGGASWTHFATNVDLDADGVAQFSGFNGEQGGECAEYQLYAKFQPSQQSGGPRKSSGESLNASTSAEYQTFDWTTIEEFENPIQAAWIVFNGEEYPLSINTGQPTNIPGTSNLPEEGGPPVDAFDISCTLCVTLRWHEAHTFYLAGTNHMTSPHTSIYEQIDVVPCQETTYCITLTGMSVNGQSPLVSGLHLDGSFYNLGDPHAARPIAPPEEEPTP